jgi:hypothetical protein
LLRLPTSPCLQYFFGMLIFCCCSFNSHAQLNSLGSWNIVNLKVTFSDKWSAFGEAQLRSLRFYNNFHYYEYKAAVTYKLDKNFSFTAGMGDYNTFGEGGNFKRPLVNDEFRSWLQVNLSQRYKRVNFEHRYRAEQRFTSNGFRNRFRYRLGLTAPLNKPKMEPGALYLNCSNELFFTNKAPYFERNRFFAGMGYEFTTHFAIQAGFLNQFDYRINDETGRNFFQLSWLIDLDWKKKVQRENAPASD